MGLNSRDSVVVVKEEAIEGCKDSGVQWPLSNKVSGFPHFMSFKVGQEEKAAKSTSDPLASSAYMTISTPDAFDTTHKCQMQKLSNGQGGSHFSMTSYSKQHNATFAGATAKQQLLGGTPTVAPHSISPSIGSVAGTTEPWFSPKSSGDSPQLTIFYAGMVNVFNDISPEKAQAIMFLAGNGSTTASKMAQPRAQAQVPISIQAGGGDGVLVNQRTNTPTGSGLSSAVSVSSHPVGQCGNGTTNNHELMGVKPTGASNSQIIKASPQKVVASLGPLVPTTMAPSAIPQARQASLARFLKKRKERVMNAAPYLAKKSPECSTP